MLRKEQTSFNKRLKIMAVRTGWLEEKESDIT
jgi:hypothetical protein